MKLPNFFRRAFQAKAPARQPELVPTVAPAISDFSPLFFGGRRLDPANVRLILQNAAAGSLQDQWELFSMMEDTWPRLMKNLGEVRSPASRVTYSVKPYATRGEEPTGAALEKADLVESAMKNWLPKPGTLELGFEDMLEAALDAYGKGISALEVTWQRHEEGILPRCAHLLSPTRYGWNAEGNELGLISRVSDRFTSTAWEPFAEGQFIVGIWNARAGAPGATARLRALAPYWVGITFGWEWLLATAQIFGVPFRWATYDPNQPGLLNQLTGMLQQMGAAGYAAFPQGTELEFKDAIARSADNPQVLIQSLANQACDLLILGQELSGSAQPQGLGSGSSVLQGGVRREVLNAAARWCADLVNYQLIPAVLRWNWGETAEAPTVLPDLAGEPDPKAMAERDQILLEAGAPLPKAWFYERHNVPEPEEGEETISGAGINSPPAGGASSESTPGMPQGSPESSPGNSAVNELGGITVAPGPGKLASVQPPRSAVAPAEESEEAEQLETKAPPSASAVPGGYQASATAQRRLAAAKAQDFEPLRKAAGPLLSAIEAGKLDVVGELEAFIAHLDRIAPQVVGAAALADSLEKALTEAAIAGAAGVYAKTPSQK